jgi:hypothetical protein
MASIIPLWLICIIPLWPFRRQADGEAGHKKGDSHLLMKRKGDSPRAAPLTLAGC